MSRQASHPSSLVDLAQPASPTQDTFDTQWHQVLARDHQADGRFFYAVKSTKIYCRPSCPSRRPVRANVTFFPTAAAAEQSGFRPCKRCVPESAEIPGDPHAARIAQAADYLRGHAFERITLLDLARMTGLNRLTLLRAFRRVLGVSPGEFVKAQRLAHFKQALHPSANSKSQELPAKTASRAHSRKRITDAIYDAGFGSSSRLYESSRESLGMNPRVLRAGGAGQSIRYTVATTPLGRMLVAATSIGVCAIAFGASDSELLDDLRRRFPNADIATAERNTPWLGEAVAFIASQTTEHPLAATFPLDIRATAFQQRVWKALQQIPRGETRSYSEVARQLGHPTAVRAVGAAVGANPVAVIVPCHRVIGQNGSLTGYRWGLERKRKLLAAEAASAASKRAVP